MQINGALVALLVPLVAAYLGSVVQRNLKERERFIKAAENFRSAFHHAIAELTDINEITSIGGFRLEYADHRKAMVVFRDFLNTRRRVEFDQTWNRYENYCNSGSQSGGTRHFSENTNDSLRPWFSNQGVENLQLAAKDALAHIDSLMAFTKPKWF